uniref:(northern house mosquito) hypothetical protein n=1 Tax=Culex pipiens TaxID=7175 RepID=A0A8D8H293_CULPI
MVPHRWYREPRGHRVPRNEPCSAVLPNSMVEWSILASDVPRYLGRRCTGRRTSIRRRGAGSEKCCRATRCSGTTERHVLDPFVAHQNGSTCYPLSSLPIQCPSCAQNLSEIRTNHQGGV